MHCSNKITILSLLINQILKTNLDISIQASIMPHRLNMYYIQCTVCGAHSWLQHRHCCSEVNWQITNRPDRAPPPPAKQTMISRNSASVYTDAKCSTDVVHNSHMYVNTKFLCVCSWLMYVQLHLKHKWYTTITLRKHPWSSNSCVQTDM